MSFTSIVKEELIGQKEGKRYELSSMIKMSGSLGLTGQGLSLSITSESAKLARYLYALIEQFYQIEPEIKYHQKTNLKKNRVYTVFLAKNVENILKDLQLADAFFGIETGIEAFILADDQAGRDYLRGAFLAAGSLRDPESGKYQLEIFSVYRDHAEGLAQLLQKFMLDAKVIEHKSGAVTYLQKAEDIMDFLILIKAPQALATFENAKLLREARNDLNRANNVETANIARTVTASMKTIANIKKISDQVGLESLPYDLRQIADIRLQHPDYSLQEIAQCLEKPLTKSGVNHRLRKLNKIADNL